MPKVKMHAVDFNGSTALDYIDYPSLKASGVDGIIIKVSEGTWWNNAINWKDHANRARAIGMKVGLYMYSEATSVAYAIQESEFFVKNVGDFKPDLGVWYDLEAGYWNACQSKGIVMQCIRAFRDTVTSAGFDKWGVYVNISRWYSAGHTKESVNSLGGYLWGAQYPYNSNTFNDLITPSADVDIWQQSGDIHLAGHKGKAILDLDIIYTDGFSGHTIEEVAPVGKLTAKRLIEIAAAEIGYHEKASNNDLDDKTANSGSGNFTKYGRDLGLAGYYNGLKNGYAWCDQFVDWCFYQLADKNPVMAQEIECQTGPLGAACAYSAQYYKNQGRFFTAPEVGDQIFFVSNGDVCHTGIVERFDSSRVYTIEGNTTDSVARRSYSLLDNYIYGYGRPKYGDAADVSTAPPQNPVSPAVKPEVNNSKPLISMGARGEYVTLLQKSLLDLGYELPLFGADGDFGRETDAAVREFQRDVRIDVDGECGAITWGKVDEAIGNKKEPEKEPAKPVTFVLGEIVEFIGNRHYINSNTDNGYTCRPGKAKITVIANAPCEHPYHLEKIAGSDSTVYGWVDAKDVKKI